MANFKHKSVEKILISDKFSIPYFQGFFRKFEEYIDKANIKIPLNTIQNLLDSMCDKCYIEQTKKASTRMNEHMQATGLDHVIKLQIQNRSTKILHCGPYCFK